jgi:hypothetical protein
MANGICDGILTLYSLYYNETRTHLGLGKDAATTIRPTVWDYYRDTNLVWIASSLRADVIFGNDKPHYGCGAVFNV